MTGCQCQALLLSLPFNTRVQLNTQRPLPSPFSFCFGEKCSEEPIAFYSTLSQSNENGYDDYMCKCTKSLTLQRYIIPKLQKILKHAFNFFFKGLLNASPEKGGCSENQQLLVRISWHICDQHVIAASS